MTPVAETTIPRRVDTARDASYFTACPRAPLVPRCGVVVAIAPSCGFEMPVATISAIARGADPTTLNRGRAVRVGPAPRPPPPPNPHPRPHAAPPNTPPPSP